MAYTVNAKHIQQFMSKVPTVIVFSKLYFLGNFGFLLKLPAQLDICVRQMIESHLCDIRLLIFLESEKSMEKAVLFEQK